MEIYETFPLLLCHDTHFYVNIGFEEDTWSGLSKTLEQEKMKLCEMPHYRLLINKFKLQLRDIGVAKIFTSHA